ncbi:MAG: recombinase family protein, partial [Bradymonadaceae bacterium]
HEDAGASAKDLDRDGLRAALDALKAGEANGLVVYKLDRLTRSTADLGRLLETFDERDLALQSVAESLDTSTAAGRMVVRMLGVVAEWERETIGERTSAALQAKAANGEYTGGNVPYGYTLDEDGETLVEDPDEQRAIEAIRTYRDAGLTLQETAERLAERGMYNRNGSEFALASVSNLEDRGAA